MMKLMKTICCRCDPSIKNMRVYYNYVDDFELVETKYAFNRERKLWTDPQWKILPLCLRSFIAHFAQLVPWKDMRQNFLMEDLLSHYDDGALSGASMYLDRGAECTCLLQEDLHHVETSVPVPLKHILPQKFTTQLLIQTLRKIDRCQGVQRPVSENQLMPESLNWFLDFKISGRRQCLKCTLKIAVCSEEIMEE